VAPSYAFLPLETGLAFSWKRFMFFMLYFVVVTTITFEDKPFEAKQYTKAC